MSRIIGASILALAAVCAARGHYWQTALLLVALNTLLLHVRIAGLAKRIDILERRERK